MATKAKTEPTKSDKQLRRELDEKLAWQTTEPPDAEPPEKTEEMKRTDWEAIRDTVEDYKAYAAQVMTSPELKVDVERNCKRLLEIADRFESTAHPPQKNEPSKPNTKTAD